MKVIDHINQPKDVLISFEVLPPLKGKGIEALYRHLDPLMEFKPAYINVTYHRSEHVFKKRTDGSFEKVIVRKRPGTESICAAIMNKYTVDTVPHLICGGFSINETEDALINLRYLGIDNVLVLRGDAAKNETAFEPEPDGHKYASDLLRQVVNLNAGIYLEDDLKGTQKTEFCIGVAGYPEKHFEAPIKAFQFARENGIHCTAHAGEASGADSVWETLNHLHPSRIGHGVRSVEDPALIHFLKQHHIHLEVCPTSNIQTNVFDTIQDHPADFIYRAGVSMSINTDARTITDVTLGSEYQLMEKVFGWNAEHFMNCNLEAIKHSFTGNDHQLRLQEKIRSAYQSLV